jgi:hypothetical protein
MVILSRVILFMVILSTVILSTVILSTVILSTVILTVVILSNVTHTHTHTHIHTQTNTHILPKDRHETTVDEIPVKKTTVDKMRCSQKIDGDKDSRTITD